MTYATFEAAINALDSVPATQEGIMNFVRQLSVQADGAVTYLYAGEVNGTEAWRIVNAIDDVDTSQIRHIGKTIASEVLDSYDFKAKVAQAFGLGIDQFQGILADKTNTTDPAKLWLNKGGSGPWATISEMFVEATTGKVRILTENPAMDSVLLVNELPTNNRGQTTVLR